MRIFQIEGKTYLAKEKGHKPTEFLVKALEHTGYICLSERVSVPKELIGKRIQLRVEVIE